MATFDSINRRQPPTPQSLSQPQPPQHQPSSSLAANVVASSTTTRRTYQKQKQERRFRLLLPQITISSGGATTTRGAAAGYHHHHHSFTARIKKLMLVTVGPILLLRWLVSSSGQTNNQQEQHPDPRTTDNAVDRNNNSNNYNWTILSAEEQEEEKVAADDDDAILQEQGNNRSNHKFITNNSNNLTADSVLSLPPRRSFHYIGDIDPASPQPWPKEEVDWWAMHRKLVEDVRLSDALPPTVFIKEEGGGVEENDGSSHHQQQWNYLPQLIFYGDSITKRWVGTLFGNIPPRSIRNDSDIKDQQIRLFQATFGNQSPWGRRALKQPLILGIGGSRTYDLLWRIGNGEFPTSQLLKKVNDEEERQKAGINSNAVESPNNNAPSGSSFPLQKLERIYIVLIGTNNLGGGMLPAQTVEGMDAVGRTLLRLHVETFSSTTPAAIVFSELLPRRDNHRAKIMCPPRCKNSTTLEPYSSFMPAIDAVNRALPRVVDGWRNDFPNSRIVLLSSSPEDDLAAGNGDGDDDQEDKDDNVPTDSFPINQYTHRVNCGREMFSFDNGDDEFVRYMPDHLHPNVEGYELWSRCLKKGLEAIMMDSTIHLEQR